MKTNPYVALHHLKALFKRILSQRFIFIFIKGLVYKIHKYDTSVQQPFQLQITLIYLIIGVFMQRNWKQVGSHLDSATICYTLRFPIEMVARMSFFADFLRVKRFEIGLHGVLSDENSKSILISNCLGQQCSAIGKYSTRHRNSMYFSIFSYKIISNCVAH